MPKKKSIEISDFQKIPTPRKNQKPYSGGKTSNNNSLKSPNSSFGNIKPTQITSTPVPTTPSSLLGSSMSSSPKTNFTLAFTWRKSHRVSRSGSAPLTSMLLRNASSKNFFQSSKSQNSIHVDSL